ncbi:MAG: SurA N-terminal domain-containing protein [Candidatus Azobacteroides sp.]|nr:SurA N-terminal domain-containing protein [Candidatus Azobacteroides sp.]
MATLEKIRGKAGLLVVVLGIALLAFIVGDLFNIGSAFGRDAQEKMITVNGETISRERYQDEVDRFTKIREQYSGRTFSGEEESYQIRQNVFEMLISSELIRAQAEKAGLTVSDAEVSDMIFGREVSQFIQSYPGFVNPQTGTFDRNMLMQFAIYSDSIPQLQDEWRFVKIMTKEQRLQEKYNALLSKALAPNTLDAKFNFESTLTSADFAYVFQSYASIPDSVIEVTKKDLKNLYNERKQRYKQNEDSRAVKYITLDINPSDEDYAAEEKAILDVKKPLEDATTTEEVADAVGMIAGNRFVNAFVSVNSLAPRIKSFVDTARIGTVVGPYLEGNTYKMIKYVDRTVAPDSVSFYQLGFPASDNAEMISFIDSLMNEVKGGKEMDEIARNFGSSSPLLSLTEVQLLNEFGEKFKDEIYTLPLNDARKVNSDNGIHIVVVTKKSQPVEKVKVAEVENAVYASSKTRNAIYNEANQFVTYNTDLKKFEEGAAEKGYVVSPTVYLSPNDLTIGNVRRSRDVVRWAFNADPGKVKFFEGEDKIVIAALEAKVDKGYRPEALVEEELKREVINNKKAEKIIADMKSKSASTLEAYAQALALKVDTAKFVNFNTGSITGIGMEPVLEALAPIAPEGKISDPVKGNNGVYIFQVYNKTDKTIEFNPESEIAGVKRTNIYRIPTQAMKALRDKAKIEDNRILFY